MKLLAWTACALAACSSTEPTMPSDAAPDVPDAAPGHRRVYVSGYGPDISWLDLELATGALTPLGSIAVAGSPSFLALTATHLYAATEATDRVRAYAIGATGALTFINDVASQGEGPAHVSLDRAGRFVMVANYGSGTVAVLPVRADGGVSAATQTLAPGINAHMIVSDPGNTHVFVPCKGADLVAQYDLSAGTLTPNQVASVATAAGAGPRHLAFGRDHAYLINENDSTLTMLDYNAGTGRLTAQQTVSTRQATTGSNTGAEVVVHPSGRFVYASNRGDNDVAIFAIDPATGRVTARGHTPTGGATPRAFAIDPSGAWLLVANQDGNSITTFAIDPVTGALTARGTPWSTPKPAFVGFAP